MAKKTTAKERMVGEEDSEILHITSTISEMEISDSKHSRNAKDEVVNIESEFPKTSPRDQTTNIQQLKSFVDDEKVSELDQDQDQTHPAYIPRIGQFFMHDTRETCERITPHLLSRADCKWRHDLYNEIDQIPISNQEFAKKYGVDREGNPISSVRQVKIFVESMFSMLRLKQTILIGKELSRTIFHGLYILSRANLSTKLLQELFSAFQHDMRRTNQTRIRTSTNVWNASRCFARTHKIHGHGANYENKRKGVKKQENSNRLSFVGNILNEEHSSVWENKKLDGGKEAESKSETHNTYNNRAKMEMRLGKRYSTQRPIKSFEM
uniref:Protein CASC3 n=1 Tax=Wuchereria bancrofti TaxID=6293 RepID=A0A1I8EZT6_WUCBA